LKFLRLTSIATLLFACFGELPAQITTFTDVTSFTTAAGATQITVEDFTAGIHFPITTGTLSSSTNLAVSNGTPITPGLIKAGVTYSTAIGTGNFFNIDSGANFTGGFLDSVTGVGALTVTFNSPVFAFGFDTTTFMGSTFNLTINFTAGSAYTNTFTIPSSTPSFFGFQSSQKNINSFVLLGSSAVNTFAIDNFRFQAIPEPSTVALLGAGLGLTALLGFRRRHA
jgi:hypothetical protein